jgi:hypothetical protein
MRNVKPGEYDATPRPVVVICNSFAAGDVIPPHHHRRSQLVYGASGTMVVETQQGRWIVPPDRAVWIPAGVTHNLAMIGAVTTMTVWVEPNAMADLPQCCQVVEISSLMRSLLAEAIDIEPVYEFTGREGVLMALLLHELKSLHPLGLSLHFPKHERLAARCREFLSQPNPASHDRILERGSKYEPTYLYPAVPERDRAKLRPVAPASMSVCGITQTRCRRSRHTDRLRSRLRKSGGVCDHV